MSDIIDAFEFNFQPKTKIYCEPFLSKKEMHPKISKKDNYKGKTSSGASERWLDLVAYANGKNTIFDIANLTQIPLKKVIKNMKILKKNKLIK